MPSDAIQVEPALLSPPISLLPFCIHVLLHLSFSTPPPLYFATFCLFLPAHAPLHLLPFPGGCGCLYSLAPQATGLRKAKMAPRSTNGFVPVPGTTWEQGCPLTHGPSLAEMHLSRLEYELPAEQSSAEESLFGGGKVDAVPLPACLSVLSPMSRAPGCPTLTCLQDTPFTGSPPALGDHLSRSRKGLSAGKSHSALLLDVRDSTGTSLLGEAKDMGLCHMGKPVPVLVTAAGPPLPMAAVRARAWRKKAVVSCRGGDDAEVMAGSSWHGASLWWAGRLEGPCWMLPWSSTATWLSSPFGQALEGPQDSLAIHDCPALCAGAAQVPVVPSWRVVLGWAGVVRVQGEGTQSLPAGLLGPWQHKAVCGCELQADGLTLS